MIITILIFMNSSMSERERISTSVGTNLSNRKYEVTEKQYDEWWFQINDRFDNNGEGICRTREQVSGSRWGRKTDDGIKLSVLADCMIWQSKSVACRQATNSVGGISYEHDRCKVAHRIGRAKMKREKSVSSEATGQDRLIDLTWFIKALFCPGETDINTFIQTNIQTYIHTVYTCIQTWR